jgi:hypothetical protein
MKCSSLVRKFERNRVINWSLIEKIERKVVGRGDKRDYIAKEKGSDEEIRIRAKEAWSKIPHIVVAYYRDVEMRKESRWKIYKQEMRLIFKFRG